MQKPSIPHLVFSQLFPNPKSSDPRDFDCHVQRNIIQEVRSETVCFYGPIDCLEAQYPGLDYANPAHRVRLGRYPWHNKLFNVFDELRLSDHEIQTLCKWEGTRWTRENYEKSEGVIIKDTTWDHIAHAGYRAPTATRTSLNGLQEVDQETGEMNEDEVESEEDELEEEDDDDEMGDPDSESVDDADEDEEESEDEISQSIGNDLNRRLLLAADARARGEDVVLDPDWEQWLKEAAERGDGPYVFGLLGGTNSSQAVTAHQQMPFSPPSTDPSILEEEEDSQPDYMQPPSTALGMRAASTLSARGLGPTLTHIPTLTPLPHVPLAQSGSIVGSTSSEPPTEAAA